MCPSNGSTPLRSPQPPPSEADISIESIDIPDHPSCTEALAVARSSLPPSILNHSIRVYLYARAFATDPPPALDTATPPPPEVPVAPHVLFVASILHDVGTSAVYDELPSRFEVCGASAAAELLRRHGADDTAAREVWLAIALHTSPGLAEPLGGVVRAVRLGVRADFGSHPPPAATGVLSAPPRLNVEEEF